MLIGERRRRFGFWKLLIYYQARVNNFYQVQSIYTITLELEFTVNNGQSLMGGGIQSKRHKTFETIFTVETAWPDRSILIDCNATRMIQNCLYKIPYKTIHNGFCFEFLFRSYATFFYLKIDGIEYKRCFNTEKKSILFCFIISE